MVTQQERDACAQAIQADPVAVSNALLDEIARLRSEVAAFVASEGVRPELMDAWQEIARLRGDVRYYKGLHDAFLDRTRANALLREAYDQTRAAEGADDSFVENLKTYLTECGIKLG